MKYGYFDLKNKEYVITRPDTPAPWANYLGSPEYGAIISNNAAGYSFIKSGANGRITRFRFNTMMDLPGRYIYIRDKDMNDYWSASWQPVGKPLDKYESECRHGTAYTVISSQYEGIAAQTTYYVPLDKTYEVWNCKITNNSDRVRNLSAFGFIEFTNESNYEQDQINLQYSLFISQTSFEKNKICQHISLPISKGEACDGRFERFLALTGAEVTAYEGDLSSFIGPYRTFANPIAVESGKCTDKLNYNSNSCGALQSDITLAPGESVTLTYLLGGKNSSEADEIIAEYNGTDKVERDIEELKKFWHSKLENFTVETPDDEFNNMINVWNAYQCFITFIWSRAASFIYCGLRNGYGYRDTVQDIQGIIHLDPELACEKIRFMLSAQVDNGGGLPLVKFTHNAGHEDTPDDDSYVRETGHPSYRADDALWLFPTVYKYIAESGNKAFLDEKIPFANKDEGTVYEHLKRAINFSMERLGPNKLPAGLHADWNDCLRLGAKGETTFVAFQLYLAMDIMSKYAKMKNDSEYTAYLDKVQEELKTALGRCWDSDRFIRGIRDNGIIVGARNDVEANIWLEPQCWSVISGYASKEQGDKAMDTVDKKLNTKYGARVMAPSYVDHAFDGALMKCFNPSTKENGGIFSQPQGWVMLAESYLGHGDAAYKYFRETSPAAMNEHAEIRVLEPYAHGQFTESVESLFEGRSQVHWLTGTGSTVMVGCIEGILGMRPNVDGIEINPSISSSWKEVKITKKFRGKTLNILIDNSDGHQSGVKSMTVNGKAVEGCYVAADELEDENTIVVKL